MALDWSDHWKYGIIPRFRRDNQALRLSNDITMAIVSKQFLYSNLVLPTIIAASRLIALKNPKMRDTLAGHKGIFSRLEAQIKNRDTAPLVWFHVASAGEYLQALPVMERLMHNHIQCALTITSVSGYRWASKQQTQYPKLVVVDYFPLDTKTNNNRLLDILKPDAVVFVDADIWPNLIWETQKRQIPQFLISARLSETSRRISSPLMRRFYGSLYACINYIFTVTEADKKRFLHSCPSHKGISVVGNTRFDSVLDRKSSLQAPALPEFIKSNTVIVLGSIWPADEQCIFPALVKALKQFPDLLIIAAPHEIEPTHINQIQRVFSDFKPVLFSANKLTPLNRVLIVDVMGLLSGLYTYADLAYVGGGFSTGVHNTMEPCAMGAATVFGPRFQNATEAIHMVETGICFSIKDESEFESRLMTLLINSNIRKQAGESAKKYIHTKAGASMSCFNKINACIAT